MKGAAVPTSADVRKACEFCRAILESRSEADWSVRAGSLEWDCRQTVAHISDALGFYAMHLGGRATHWLKFDIVPHADASNRHLGRLVGATGEVLAQVLDAAPEDAEAFHHSGMWDKTGFAAMGCLEALVHTGDVIRGLGGDFDPPRDVCDRVIQRLFPDVPPDHDSWSALWWATGRGVLPGRTSLGARWMEYWMRRWGRS